MKDPNSDKIDTFVEAVNADKPSSSDIEAAAQRVRDKLLKEDQAAMIQQTETVSMDETMVHSNEIADSEVVASEGDDSTQQQFNSLQQQFNSLQQYIDAIPDYLANRLSPALNVLFEEETRRSIELRRALNDAKKRANQNTKAQPVKSKTSSRFAWFYSAAAALVLTISFILVSPKFPSFNQSQLAQVEDVNGNLYQLNDGNMQPLSAGDWIDGSQVVRTAGDTTAMLVLDDGSRIEVGPRAELQFMRRSHGNRIDVDRGKIIVAASPQGSGTLDVMTEEFVVSVVGTIFEVGHGANGSRVSVIEGEVQVQQRGDSTSVVPGEQFATRMGKKQLGVENNIAWSRNADEYITMLQEVAALQRDIENVLTTEPRYSKRLLNLTPENTVFYGAVPNAPEKIVEIYTVIRDRVKQSEVMSKKFDSLEMDEEFTQLDGAINWLAEMGDTLGDETVAALKLVNGESGQSAIPVILSEVDADAFRASFESRLASWKEKNLMSKAADGSESVEGQSGENQSAQSHSADFDIAIIDNPSQALPNQLSIWLNGDLLVATIGVETIQEIAESINNNGSNFMSSGLYTQLVSYYDGGAKFLGGVDLQSLLGLQNSAELGAEEKAALDFTGLGNAQFMMVHHSQDSSETNFNAELIFDSERTGIMSWLAEPAPMGSLDFFSINTAFVSASIVKTPKLILDEIKQISGEEWGEVSSESELAVELGEGLLASVGGEMAFGFDGPALPTPSWKIVLEVTDENLLQETISRMIKNANEQMAESDRHVKIAPLDLGSYNAYQIELSINLNMAEAGTSESGTSDTGASDTDASEAQNATEISITYAYLDGYLIVSPNAAFLERAINQYHSGIGLLSSRAFQSLLARSGSFDVSALNYSRLDQLLSDLTKSLPKGLSRQQHKDLNKIRGENREPSFLTLTGHPESIRLTHSGNFFPDISSIMSMQSLAGVLLGNEEFLKDISENDKDPD